MEGIGDKVGILLVDDDDAVRGLARVILEHEGWHVMEAGSVGEATGRVRDGGFRPHVAVVDLFLPDGLGTELSEDLLLARHKSRIIYITGDPGWLRRLNAGSESVLAKPFTPVQLVAAVRAALEAMKPVIVFVESGLVYRRLILSALEHVGVEVTIVSSFEEGLLVAHQREAAVLFTPSPGGDDALAALLNLRSALPRMEVIALASDPSPASSGWYDRRLVSSYSVQELAEVVVHAVNRRWNPSVSASKGSEVSQDGEA